jgi:hypothetical protein
LPEIFINIIVSRMREIFPQAAKINPIFTETRKLNALRQNRGFGCDETNRACGKPSR